MTTIAGIDKNRILEAGSKEPQETLNLPGGQYALWLVDGSAEWQTPAGDRVLLSATESMTRLTGPGTVSFTQKTHYVWLLSEDPLGFGSRAPLYRAIMQSHNRGIGQALADGLTLRAGQLWVDLGTGTGAMVQALQSQAMVHGPVWILGIDRAAGMLDQAWTYATEASPAWFVEHDISTLSWPHHMIDGVTALLVLHLVDDLDALLTHVYQALRPGGIFAYAVSADGNPFVRMIMRQIDGAGTFFKRSSKRVRQQVLKAGFSIINEDTYEDEITLDNPAAMRDLIASIGAPASFGLRADVLPPSQISRQFDLVWAQKPAANTKED